VLDYDSEYANLILKHNLSCRKKNAIYVSIVDSGSALVASILYTYSIICYLSRLPILLYILNK
jgi:hypothetical protein